MVSKAQQRASKKWNEKNKDKRRVYQYRSYAKKYIKEIATEEELKKLLLLIHDRLDGKL